MTRIVDPFIEETGGLAGLILEVTDFPVGRILVAQPGILALSGIITKKSKKMPDSC